jgi:GDP-D-mannose 3', 5'-epimerase
MKRAVVCGAAGFIGSHLTARLKAEGYYVIGISRSPHKYDFMKCDEFYIRDLCEPDVTACYGPSFVGADEVYQMAGEVGGLGYIMDRSNDATMLRNTTLIDINVLEACRKHKVGKVFFASSACVYPDIKRPMKEIDAYPAAPLNEFAWQKIFAERLYVSYARQYGMDIRIGRLFNTYGPGMTWQGGREKSVAALCRKIVELPDGGVLNIWGHGHQRRSYTYIDNTITGILALTRRSRFVCCPYNIGYQIGMSIWQLAEDVGKVAGKSFIPVYDATAPVGVSDIVADCSAVRELTGWHANTSVPEGLEKTYPWIQKQLALARNAA